MEVSIQEAAAAISLQSIQAIKKEREKSIAVGRMAKTSLPARKGMITFNCKLFSVSYSSCLATNEAEARNLPRTYGRGILPRPQFSLMGQTLYPIAMLAGGGKGLVKLP